MAYNTDEETNFRIAMETFMRGEWTKTTPTKPGMYPVRSHDWYEFNWKFIEIEDICGECIPTENWDGGWWWSEPQPEFPEPPTDTAKDESSNLIQELRDEVSELKKIVLHYEMVYGKEY